MIVHSRGRFHVTFRLRHNRHQPISQFRLYSASKHKISHSLEYLLIRKLSLRYVVYCVQSAFNQHRHVWKAVFGVEVFRTDGRRRFVHGVWEDNHRSTVQHYKPAFESKSSDTVSRVRTSGSSEERWALWEIGSEKKEAYSEGDIWSINCIWKQTSKGKI